MFLEGLPPLSTKFFLTKILLFFVSSMKALLLLRLVTLVFFSIELLTEVVSILCFGLGTFFILIISKFEILLYPLGLMLIITFLCYSSFSRASLSTVRVIMLLGYLIGLSNRLDLLRDKKVGYYD